MPHEYPQRGLTDRHFPHGSDFSVTACSAPEGGSPGKVVRWPTWFLVAPRASERHGDDARRHAGWVGEAQHENRGSDDTVHPYRSLLQPRTRPSRYGMREPCHPPMRRMTRARRRKPPLSWSRSGIPSASRRMTKDGWRDSSGWCAKNFSTRDCHGSGGPFSRSISSRSRLFS